MSVELPVKERLVGAAVLMAAAIILIPEMLSGPDRGDDTQAGEPAAGGEAPIKTYTIDLNQPPGTPAASSVVEGRAPPAEEIPLAPPPSVTAESAAQTRVRPETSREPPLPAAASANAPVVQGAAPVPSVVEPPTSSSRAPASEGPRPLASSPGAPISDGWAVQLGSFSKQSTAERLISELRGQGHDAFVMPVKSGATTLYRVRIGPMKDRASAEETLRAVKGAAPGAAIVAHP